MSEEKNRAEVLDEIFADDPVKKAREKEIKKLEKKYAKKREKLAKMGLSEDEIEETMASSEEETEETPTEEEVAEEAPKKKKKKKKQKKQKPQQHPDDINIVKDLITLLMYILVIVVLCWIVLTYVGQRTVVSGDSMNDTLSSGDSLWIDKISYRFSDPERFDIVVFPYGEPDEDGEETYYIKRIIGLPGETIYIDDEGNIYIDGEILEEDYGKEVIAEGHLGIFAYTDEPITLGEDEYFVLGDNRNNSRDSRLSDVGNISREDLIGKAVFRFGGGFGFLE